ncbi:hypothetical protein GCM10027570_07450 [Streptomonospora sediminis]
MPRVKQHPFPRAEGTASAPGNGVAMQAAVSTRAPGTASRAAWATVISSTDCR